MSDLMVSLIRTYVPVVVGAAIAFVAQRGLDLSEVIDTQALTLVCIAGYYALARWAEQRWPWAGFLLGSRRQPGY